MAKKKERHQVATGVTTLTIGRKEATRRILDLTGDIYTDIVRRKRKPEMKFPVRALTNVKYDPRKGYFEILGHKSTRTLTYNTVKTFAQSVRLLSTTKKDMLDKNDITDLRTGDRVRVEGDRVLRACPEQAPRERHTRRARTPGHDHDQRREPAGRARPRAGGGGACAAAEGPDRRRRAPG